MIQYFTLKDIQVSKNSLVLNLKEGSYFVLSKKFAKFDPKTNRWYFNKLVHSLNHKTIVEVVTFLNIGEVYIAEINNLPSGSEERPVTIKDLITLDEVNRYGGLILYAKENNRS